jgi:hypothetical protein
MPSGLAAFNARTLANWTQKRLKFSVRLQLNIQRALNNSRLTLAQRVRLAGQFLRDAVVVNLSRPVRKYTGPISGRIQVDPKSRSEPGEFPRADTTRLMKDIFHKHYPEECLSRVGTTLKYGLILETRMDRSFLRRTLREKRRELFALIRGGGQLGGRRASA